MTRRYKLLTEDTEVRWFRKLFLKRKPANEDAQSLYVDNLDVNIMKVHTTLKELSQVVLLTVMIVQ